MHSHKKHSYVAKRSKKVTTKSKDIPVPSDPIDSTNLENNDQTCTIKEYVASDNVAKVPVLSETVDSTNIVKKVQECIISEKVAPDNVIVFPEPKIEKKAPVPPFDQVQKKEVLKNKLNSSKEKKVPGSTTKLPPKKNEHEEEKEIMRKAKENINRRTRPIIKYVDDSNDLLRIDKNEENINNWEDLFDEDGQLQCNLLNDITQKVGEDVTYVTALEDYSAYASKPLENLEHVVELYGFPPSLETHDIMQSFSFIKSDAMYIKWVDDTHALLVLGSLTQAQRAVEHTNPLIKVRPMTAASAVALEAANKSDLKPAMKRPQTNLQTARRLITTHLGAKSRISREQTAREREDLKTAREMRKIAKQNEKDAWEGNLRSAMK